METIFTTSEITSELSCASAPSVTGQPLTRALLAAMMIVPVATSL